MDRCYGSFLGLAIGDAMGAPVEFSPPGTFEPISKYRAGGPFNLPAGYWTDDTTMAICIAESLIQYESLNLEDQMQRFLNWYRNGYASSTGTCFDIGNGTCLAIENYERNGLQLAPESSGGNGSLMRIAPIPIAFIDKSIDEVYKACELNSLLTHNKYASQVTAKFGVVLHKALNGASKEELQLRYEDYMDYEPRIWNSGYAPEALFAALHHFYSTNSFEEAILQAVNCGDDSDTIGAITGQLAGAYYGAHSFPGEWIKELYDYVKITKLTKSLFAVVP